MLTTSSTIVARHKQSREATLQDVFHQTMAGRSTSQLRLAHPQEWQEAADQEEYNKTLTNL